MEISADALNVLERSVSDSSNQAVSLPAEQLERALYDEINDVLSRLGGKWNKAKKAHLFPYDPTPLLAAVLETKLLPPKNPTAFFPTPSIIVDLMLEVSDSKYLGKGDKILEPSAGTGAIASAIRAQNPDAELHCCEFLEVNRAVLTNQGFEVVANDFMNYQPDFRYDLILMNPPFSLEGDSTAYISHFNHAWHMLDERGSIAAIVPTGWLYSGIKKISDFREFVCDWFEIEELGTGAFKESGTMVNTCLIYASKRHGAWRRGHQNGWNSHHAWNACLVFENDQETYVQLRAAKDRNDFEKACSFAASKMLKLFQPVVLRKEDYDELYEWFQD